MFTSHNYDFVPTIVKGWWFKPSESITKDYFVPTSILPLDGLIHRYVEENALCIAIVGIKNLTSDVLCPEISLNDRIAIDLPYRIKHSVFRPDVVLMQSVSVLFGKCGLACVWNATY
jgi:hypothetical protein